MTDGRRTRSTMAAVAVVSAVVLASCGQVGTTASQPANSSPAHGAMVIEVSAGGGLALPAVRVSDSLPRVWIADDGRYLLKTSEGSGSPALVGVAERRIPEAAVSGLLDDARAAGLLDDPDYGNPRIADAMVTRIVIVTGDTRHEVLVPALGYPNSGLTDAEVAARERLSQFLDTLAHPERVAGVSGAAPYAPTAMAVFVLGAADASAPTPPAAWPLGDLGTGGTPMDWPDRAARCLMVTGGDVVAVAAAAAGKDRFTPWRSGDGLWKIALRPLLPDEHSCADVVRSPHR